MKCKIVGIPINFAYLFLISKYTGRVVGISMVKAESLS